MSNKPAFGFVVEYVTDIEAAKNFYTEVMGLQVQRDHPTFVQFEHFAIASDKPMGRSGEPEIYWLVDDAEAAYGELSKKARVNLPLAQMPFGKVFAIDDPSGTPRFLLELSASRPSREVKP